ncbi:zinc ribbon domain-containing protein [Nocardioides seonyuensis]|uniref:Zinc ribbon domain-containing protein n=1 Tax=Nocardioides seonyuensis TaxID=2518371 RepID=A0A4P7IAM2_9ACTN|nr:zinc ribbon domain-containing protein [Nocardioides seonyuensis]QBX54058.1 zinc ribbon domain-containing protein [Nocardioides seonyuensis]
METCERCGAELGVGRFCLNCGHPVGAPVEDAEAFLPWIREDEPHDDHVAPHAPPAPEDTERGAGDEPSPAWLPWLGGTVVLVVLLLVLVSCLGDEGGDPGTAQDPTTGATTPQEPEPTGSTTPEEPKARPVDVSRSSTVTAPVTAPSTQDLDGQLVSYEAARMLDGQLATAWRMPGDGTGTTLTFRLAEPTEIVRVGLVNGYAKQIAGVDWYPNNRRITTVTWGFGDATRDQSLALRPTLQLTRVQPVTTRTVTLTITGVTPPGAGTLGRDYTAISEVRLIGRPAG